MFGTTPDPASLATIVVRLRCFDPKFLPATSRRSKNEIFTQHLSFLAILQANFLAFMLVFQRLFGFSSALATQIPSISMLYKLPSDFHVACGQQLPATVNRIQRSNVSSSLFTPILISKESSFAWGLLASSSDDSLNDTTCSLSTVCYSCKTYHLAWSACCDGHGKPFSTGGMLRLGEQRDLQLVESSGSLLWSSKALNVESIELLETGNLLLLDSQNTIVWQSFNHPSNILLPGQILTPGMGLTAGNYSASMEPGGLALYVQVFGTLLPYLVVNSTWGLSDVHAISTPVCSGVNLVYAADGSSLMMELNMGTQGSQCYNASARSSIQRSNRTVSTSLMNKTSGVFKYLRLGYNGGLQTYMDDEVEFSWFSQGDDNEGRGFCNLPGHCGDLGICDPGGQCRCPHSLVNQTVDYLMATDYSVEKPEIDDCPQIQAANCSASRSRYKVLKLQDLDYFPHRYYMPSSGMNFSMQTCVDSCMQNCSCLVAFYNNLSWSCHHYSTVLSMQRTTYGGNYLVFVKLLDDAESQVQFQSSFSNHRLNFIAIAIIFGVSLIVCLVVFLWVYKQYGGWNDEDYALEARLRRTEDDVFLGTLSGLPPRYTYKEMQEITNGFTVKLGHGSFGCVYEGALSDGSKIAVKRLEGTRQGDKEFRAEVASLAGISHVNLVKLRGFCAEHGHRMLIYEHMTNGSLDRWLARGEDGGSPNLAAAAAGRLDWRKRLQIAADAARGLAYLHAESRERIFHLDVKPQNILLDDKFVAKLSDFGLSKQLDRARSRTITSMRGTPGYLAPEWLLQTAVSDKSDVYSFGMVLLELVSGRRNVDYSSVDPDKWFWPAWVVNRVVSGLWPDIRLELSSRGWPPPQILAQGEKAIKVALWCLQEDPKSRPTMSTVLLMLEGLVHVADPPLEMRLNLEAQARLLASLHPGHITNCTSPISTARAARHRPAQLYGADLLLASNCFSNNYRWPMLTSTPYALANNIPTSAPLDASPPSPCLKQSLSI